MQLAFELGIEVPQTLQGWVDFFPRYTVLFWLKGKKHEEMQTMREYMRVAFNPKPIGVQRKNPVNQLVHRLISFPARWRLDHDFCAFPFELRLKNAANKFIAPPKPKVDAHMLETEVVTC